MEKDKNGMVVIGSSAALHALETSFSEAAKEQAMVVDPDFSLREAGKQLLEKASNELAERYESYQPIHYKNRKGRRLREKRVNQWIKQHKHMAKRK